MADSVCPHCGAPMTGFYCEYCRSSAVNPDEWDKQNAALKDFHNRLSHADKATLAVILTGGPLPDFPGLLIDEGLACLSYMNHTSLSMEEVGVSDAAATRLDSIITKLKINPADNKTQDKLAVLENKLKDYRKKADRDGWMGIFIFAAVITIIILLFCHFMQFL